MATKKVICYGLGSGSPPYEKEVDTIDLYGPHMATQGVLIAINIEAYERLVNWASMSRTLEGVIAALDEALEQGQPQPLEDKIADALSELTDVKAALDESHQAVRRHWGALKK